LLTVDGKKEYDLGRIRNEKRARDLADHYNMHKGIDATFIDTKKDS